MKKNPIRYFILSIVILILIGFLSIVNTLNLLDLENKINTNHKISKIFEQTLTNSQNALISTRDFIISGDLSELDKRDSAIVNYNNSLSDLKNEMVDPKSLAYLNILNDLRLDLIKDFKGDYIKMRKEKGSQITLEYFTKQVNHKIYNIEIPKLIKKIKEQQAKVLEKNEEKSKSETKIVILIIIVGSILSVIIAFFAIFIIKADIKTRENNERRLIDYSAKFKNRNTQLFDFSSIVSHNLRAPLVNIYMLADYLDEAEDASERKEIQTKLVKVTNHINEVFNELIDTLQVMEDIDIKSEHINLEECLRKIIKQIESQIEAESVDIQIDFSNAPEIYFPKKYMESIFSNLLSNAIKYKSPDRTPSIQFKSIKEADCVIVSVKDNGLGIDLDLHKERIFKIRQVFHNHSDSKGLGLFMTKTQINAMGDEIWVESEVNKGSTFFIKFNNQNNEA